MSLCCALGPFPGVATFRATRSVLRDLSPGGVEFFALLAAPRLVLCLLEHPSRCAWPAVDALVQRLVPYVLGYQQCQLVFAVASR